MGSCSPLAGAAGSGSPLEIWRRHIGILAQDWHAYRLSPSLARERRRTNPRSSIEDELGSWERVREDRRRTACRPECPLSRVGCTCRAVGVARYSRTVIIYTA